MRIVVTGATGFVGTPLVRDLLAAGHTVTALCRDVARAARRLPARCCVLAWDSASRLDPSALRGADAVVHLAGEGIADARWSAARKKVIRDSRVETSAALVNAMAQLGEQRPRALVSASAIGWYGDRADTALDENSSGGTGFLAEVCRDWEQAVFKAQGLGVRTAAVRIGVVLGRDGGALAPLLPLFRLGLGGHVGSGRQWFSWIHLQDLVRLLRYVVEHPAADGPINGVAPEPVTNATFAAELGRAVRRPAVLPVPAAALRVIFGEMSTVLLASQRVQPLAAQRLGFAFRHPTLRDALMDLCAANLGHELVVEQRLARPAQEVFPFFSDPANLERITPTFLRFRVLGTTTAQINDGTLINYALRLHGIPLRWQSRIESWTPNRRFVDVQTRGPYALWHHTHEFEPDDGGTIIRDRVRYRLPLGALGDWIGGALVRRDLAAIFDFRRQRIQELLG